MKMYVLKFEYYIDDPIDIKSKVQLFTNRKDAEEMRDKVIDSVDTLISIKLEEIESDNLDLKMKDAEPEYKNCRKIFLDKNNKFIFLLKTKSGQLLYANKLYHPTTGKMNLNMLIMRLTKHKTTLEENSPVILTIDYLYKNMSVYSLMNKYHKRFNMSKLRKCIMDLIENGELEVINAKDEGVADLVINNEIAHIENIIGYREDLF